MIAARLTRATLLRHDPLVAAVHGPAAHLAPPVALLLQCWWDRLREGSLRAVRSPPADEVLHAADDAALGQSILLLQCASGKSNPSHTYQAARVNECASARDGCEERPHSKLGVARRSHRMPMRFILPARLGSEICDRVDDSEDPLAVRPHRSHVP